MTIRRKVALLITAAGFLSSLVFSCIILGEMLEQPLHLIDAELEAAAGQAVRALARGDGSPVPDGGRRWLVVRDRGTGREVYRSRLAGLVEMPEPAPGAGATSSLVVPRSEVDLGQSPGDEVTFRIRTFSMASGGKTFLVTAGRPMEQLEEELKEVFVGVAGGLGFSVLLLLAISWFFAGLILKPVRVVNEQARDISEKHLDRRLPVTKGHDEFNALARTLNQVFDRLEHAFLRQKRLLADASHELKTPLTMMRLGLDAMRADLEGADAGARAQGLERMTEQVLRMERLVKSLLDLSALEIEAVVEHGPLDLAGTLRALIDDYRLMAEPRGIRMDVDLPGRLDIEGDAEKLNRAFSNILDNAVKYTPDGGRIEIGAVRTDAGLAVAVGNTAPPIPETELARIFDQFHRVEQSRSQRHGGSGLGLAIVRRIVELHGGDVRFESRPEGWARVTVHLPRRREDAPR